jgi:hypothetical protein
MDHGRSRGGLCRGKAKGRPARSAVSERGWGPIRVDEADLFLWTVRPR